MQNGMHCYGANGKILIIKRFREQDPEAFSSSPHTMNIKRTHSAVILYLVKQTYKTFHTLTADWLTGRQLPPIISLHPSGAGFFMRCTMYGNGYDSCW